MTETVVSNDKINPDYYQTSQGAQLIELVGTLPFSMGNAVKYVYRHKKKNGREDLKKALWYLNDYRNRPVVTMTPLPSPESIHAILSGEPEAYDAIIALLAVYGTLPSNSSRFDQAVQDAKAKIERLLDKIES